MPKHEINSNILYRQSQSASLEVLEEMASLEDKTTSPIDNVDQDVHRQDYY